MKAFIAVTLALLITGTGPLLAGGHTSTTKPVVVDVVELRKLAPTALYSGEVISNFDARLAAEVEGRLTWVAEVGTRAKKGDVLAELDDIFLQKQRKEELAIIQSEQAKLDLHSKDVERYQRLVKEKNIAESQLDQSISDQKIASSNINASQARLAQLNERIVRSKLRAPFKGVVTERFTQRGEWAQNGDPLVRLVDVEDPEIQVRVPQSIFPLISLGDILSAINNGLTIEARVETIVPVGTTASRLFELRLTPLKPIFPGTLVRVVIPTAAPKEVLSVDRDALVIRKDEISVFRVNQGVTEQIPVKVGVGSGQYVEIIGAINAGDNLVTRGGERLRSGDKVKISGS